MFGESESESPRVPSPWDNLISASPSPTPGRSRSHTPSPLASELALVQVLPRLVPECDDGNVEYKLQLLNPSPARFARLVTQLKWRLLEGGGQAYYELGVADSGDLVGLPREELEQTLETLEMMAGEIGASVIVVKEVEVPAVIARLAQQKSAERDCRRIGFGAGNDEDEYSSSGFTTEATTDGDEDDLSSTVVLDRSNNGSTELFMMDGDEAGTQKFAAIDLEISTVFKPRPVRTRVHNFSTHLLVGGKAKRTKKPKHLIQHHADHKQSAETKAEHRKQTRDRKREEKRQALLAKAAQSVDQNGDVSDPIVAPLPILPTTGTAALVDAVTVDESVAVSSAATTVIDPPAPATTVSTLPLDEDIPGITVVADVDEEDDVFGLPSPTTSKLRSFPTFAPSTTGESHLDVDTDIVKLAAGVGSISVQESNGAPEDDKPRLIVEALVVRKMSLEEGFLDFGGFAIL